MPPGDYVILVEDEAGCTIDTSVTILPGISVDVDLGDDLFVDAGTLVEITAVLEGDTLGQLQWFLNGVLYSQGSPTSISFPVTETSEVAVIAESSLGCTATDSLVVRALGAGTVLLYVPDILYPESSSGNDLLRIRLTEDVQILDYFRIYDRWGQLLVNIENRQDTDDIVVWDGRMNNRPVMSGVYVYVYSVTDLAGEKKVGAGNLTVLH